MSLSEFYTGQDWRLLRQRLMAERSDKTTGVLLCEYCHKPIVRPYECIAHHKQELTESNYKDSSISLNPSNIMLVHHQCHQKIHKKFLAGVCRKVYLVYGAPLSGKTSFVNRVMEYGDLVLDQDNIWQSISGQPRYNRPEELTPVVFSIRKEIEESIAMRRGTWATAFVIGSYPSSLERRRICNKLGAEEIYIEATKDECLERLEKDESRREVKDEWKKFIEQWFFDYSIYN